MKVLHMIDYTPKRRILILLCAAACIIIFLFLFHDRLGNIPGSHRLGNTIATLKGTTPGLFGSRAPTDEYIAICLAVRDQGRDLPEWLQHHYYNIGIGRFYIMDDGSNPPLSNLVNTYGVPPEALEFHYYDESQRVSLMQEKVYNECSVFGKQRNHTWMAFIDADEFFDAPGPESFREVLEDFDPIQVIGAVGVNWQMHSSNGQLTRAKSTFRAYTECIYDDPENSGENTDNKHIKTIVRLKNYDRFLNPHKFYLTNDTITVGEHGDRIDHIAFRRPITRDRLSLHHYVLKSKEEFQEKMERGNAASMQKDWDFWDHVEGLPHVQCFDMLRWVRD